MKLSYTHCPNCYQEMIQSPYTKIIDWQYVCLSCHISSAWITDHIIRFCKYFGTTDLLHPYVVWHYYTDHEYIGGCNYIFDEVISLPRNLSFNISLERLQTLLAFT